MEHAMVIVPLPYGHITTPMSLQGHVVENWKEFEAVSSDYNIDTQFNLEVKNDDDTPYPKGMKLVSAILYV